MKKGIKCLIVFVLCLSLMACSSSSSLDKKIINDLKDITDVDENNDIYYFEYEDSTVHWILQYSEENESVRIFDDRFEYIFYEAFGVDMQYDESYVAFDFDENEARIYFDEDVTGLSILNYNFDDDQYTANANGEHYYLSDEFEQYLDDIDFDKILEEDVNLFKDSLSENGMEYEDVKKLRYDDFE